MGWTRHRPGYTRQQRNQAARIRARDPQCQCPGCPHCPPDGCHRATTQADHIINYTTATRAGLNPDTDDNMRGLCTPCHAHKTLDEARAGRARLHPKRTPRHPSD